MTDIETLEQKIQDVVSLLRVSVLSAKEVEDQREIAVKRDYALSERAKMIDARMREVEKKEKDITAQQTYIEQKDKEISQKLTEVKSHQAENVAVKAEKEQVLRMKEDLQKKLDQIDSEKEIARKRNELLDLKERKIAEKQAALQRYLSEA